MAWITNNLPLIAGIASGIYTVGSLIARITPTDKDDRFFSFFGKIVNFLFLSSKKK